MKTIWYNTVDLKETFEFLNSTFEKDFWDLTIHYVGDIILHDRHMVPEIITQEQIIELVQETMNISINIPEYKPLLDGLYFNANLNHPTVVRERERASRVAMGIERDLTEIEPDLMLLFDLLMRNEFGKLRISVLEKTKQKPSEGRKRKQKEWSPKESVDLDNHSGWFTAYLLNGINQAIPKIDTVEKAKAYYAYVTGKRQGRKQDGELTAMAVGVARLFKGCGLIEGNTTNALCEFIRKYFLLMEVIDKNMPQKDYKNFQSSISRYIRKGELKMPKDKRDSIVKKYKRIFIKGRWD